MTAAAPRLDLDALDFGKAGGLVAAIALGAGWDDLRAELARRAG